MFDQLLRQRQLGGLHIGFLDVQVGHVTHLVGIEQLLEDQAIVAHADLHHVLLALPRPFGQRAGPGLAHGLGQQVVRLGAALVRAQIVGLVVVDRVDRAGGHEGDDVDGLLRGFLQRAEFLGLEGHIAVFLELVALDHVGALHHHVFLQADVLLAQARSAALVQQVEADAGLALGGREHFYGNRHQPEADG
ncbi:hypothetical protein D3C72_1362440 [compost metagenome]